MKHWSTLTFFITIIKSGHINTTLIKAKAITADMINADGITANNVTISGNITATSGTFDGYIKTKFKKLEDSDAETTKEEYTSGIYYYKLKTDLNIIEGAIILPSDLKYVGARAIFLDRTTQFSRSTIPSTCKSENGEPILGFPIEGTYEGRYKYNAIYFSGGIIELVGTPDRDGLYTQWAIISMSCIQSSADIV